MAAREIDMAKEIFKELNELYGTDIDFDKTILDELPPGLTENQKLRMILGMTADSTMQYDMD